MFDFDRWQEILATVKKNKLRTFLTMIGVGWGIFMLILLLGAGTGLQNGVIQNFSGSATNSVFIWSLRTTMPYKGFQPGKRTQFTTDDVKAIQDNIKEVETIVPRNQLGGGFRASYNIKRKDKVGGYQISGDYPEYKKINMVHIEKGRFINQRDQKEKRKVVIIGRQIVKELFDPEEEPLGDYIQINGVYFQIVGIFKSGNKGERAVDEEKTAYVPFNTFQQAFNYGNKVGWFALTVKPEYKASVAEEKVKALLRDRHHVHPEDNAALGSFNLQKEFQEVTALFFGIKAFIWVVGIFTLIAGIIGVSNIMLIIVKERTKEIGIRKAIGATPWSIISLILQESVVFTALAGYIGLLLGMFLVEGTNYMMQKSGEDIDMFANPTIDVPVAIASIVILVLGGLLAGIIPASKAASINPIEAIRTE